MKRYTASALGLVLLFALQAFAQEHYTEGPIWQVSLIRVMPTQMDAYLTSLQANTKSIYEEMKKKAPSSTTRYSLTPPSTIPRTGTSRSESSTKTSPLSMA